MIRRHELQHQRDPELEQRLLNCLQGGSLIMENFIRLLGVTTGPVTTAAVLFFPNQRPLLVFDKQFIEERCQRDEHLRLLAEHELWHIVLSHHFLFPAHTFEQGLCTDTIINSLLMRQYVDRPEYMGFLDTLNADDTWPNLILRPVPGWPQQPDYSLAENIGPPGTGDVMRQLYPPADKIKSVPLPLYAEILELLHWRPPKDEKEQEDSDKSENKTDASRSSDKPESQQGPADDDTSDDSQSTEPYRHIDNSEPTPEPTLLGNHEPQWDNALQHQSTQGILRELIATAPNELGQIGLGAGAGLGRLAKVTNDLEDPTKAAIKAFSKILRWAVYGHAGYLRRRQRTLVESNVARSLIPNPHDRFVAAYGELGVPKLMFTESVAVPTRMRCESGVLCYLDVSGSMRPTLGLLLSLLLPYLRRREIILYGFSTLVTGPYSTREILDKAISTSGGTNISCVMEHATQQDRIRRVLVVTDGKTGTAKPELVQTLRRRNISLVAVLIGENTQCHRLSGIASRIFTLPPLL